VDSALEGNLVFPAALSLSQQRVVVRGGRVECCWA